MNPVSIAPALFVDLAGVLLDTAPGRMPGLRAGAGPALRLLGRHDYRVIALAPCACDRRQRTGTPAQWPARLADLLARERVVLHGYTACDAAGAPCPACPPAPGMLLRAARMHHVTLPAAWLLAGSHAHVVAGQQAGCRTMRVVGDGNWPHATAPPGASAGPPGWVARDVFDAALAIVRLDGCA